MSLFCTKWGHEGINAPELSNEKDNTSKTLPEIYQKIYIFFPFPYAINAMRETIGGMYGSDYMKYLGELLLFAVAALLIGLVIRLPFVKINHFVEKRMEDTEMM